MKICIITTQHVSYNPRVVKEADALAEAGHEVIVVSVNSNSEQATFDTELMQSRSWKLLRINYQKDRPISWLRWFWSGCRKKGYENFLSRITLSHSFAERAHERVYAELCGLAAAQSADLYMAHHAQALGAAYRAAKVNSAGFAFDAEDFHSGELPPGTNPVRNRRIEYLERKYLPRCNFVTASSEDIAEALAKKYGIPLPVTILNVFPLEPIPETIVHEPPKLYWFSQVIGPGRGLEDLIRAIGILKIPVEVHLRGRRSNGFDNYLSELSQVVAPSCRLSFHGPVSPQVLIKLATEHDVGLALEPGDTVNHLLAASNKIFSYMVAGLAVVATDTPGQKRIMDKAPGAGLLCRFSSPESLAESVARFLTSKERLQAAKDGSRRAAERRFNWDTEKQSLLALVEKLPHALTQVRHFS